MRLSACTLHEAVNRVIITGCFTVFNIVTSTAALVDVVMCAQAPMSIVAKYCDERPADVLFRVSSGGRGLGDHMIRRGATR